MKKSISILLLSALLLTACDTTEENSSDINNSSVESSSSSSSSSSVSENSSSTPENSSSEDSSSEYTELTQEEIIAELKFKGKDLLDRFQLLHDYPIDFTDAVAIRWSDADEYYEQMPLNDIDNGGDFGRQNWDGVICNFIYLSEAKGIFYNSIDNADIYDKDNYKFNGVDTSVLHEYKMYKAGDKFGDLTLKKAETTFRYESLEYLPRYFYSSTAEFDGQLTLTGWCRIVPPDVDMAYVLPNDINFVPDAESVKKLPIVLFNRDELSLDLNGDFCTLGEVYEMYLGCADDYKNIDFSEMPKDGSSAKVKITINNIRFTERVKFIANIVDFEVV